MNALMTFHIITLFPEMFSSLEYGITGRAIHNHLLSLHYWNPREFAQNKHKNVDDRPYGGGPGMVMMAEPLYNAIDAAKQASASSAKVVYLSPQGEHFTQKKAESALKQTHWILLAGRYEGIDERLLTQVVDEEWSIGDYILSGGELGAMVVIDAVTRLLPGALGHAESAASDSLSTGLLKYPQYTRPETYAGESVPPVLLSGDHQAIERWRLKQSLGKTWLKRPDLFNQLQLNPFHLQLLTEFIRERNKGNNHEQTHSNH